MSVTLKHRIVIHKKFIQSFSIKENILFAVVTNVTSCTYTTLRINVMSVLTTPNQ